MEATSASVDPRLVSYTHVIYGLQAVSILVGALTTASIAGRFVFGWPSLIAVIMNYSRHHAVRGTWLETHFRWQLRTFWTAAVLIICLSPLVFTIVLIPFVIGLYAAVGIWAAYRVGRGWLALRENRAMPAGFP
ncbi:MAG: hypothetical protein WDO12_05355 [Pseudomonadota bacterium]